MGKRVAKTGTMKFQVLEGIHVDGPHIYKKDNVIETIHDLVTMFPGKFRRVDDATKATAPMRMAAMGSIGAPADVTKDNAAGNAPTDEDEDDEKGEDGEDGTLVKGVDVTDRFPTASENDYKVFKSEGQYFVYDGDTMKRVNEEGVNRTGVDQVIKDALKA